MVSKSLRHKTQLSNTGGASVLRVSLSQSPGMLLWVSLMMSLVSQTRAVKSQLEKVARSGAPNSYVALMIRRNCHLENV